MDISLSDAAAAAAAVVLDVVLFDDGSDALVMGRE